MSNNQKFTTADYGKNYILKGLDSMPGGFFIYRADESEEILYANRELLELFDCKNEDEFLALTGGCFPGLVFPDDLDEVQRNIKDQCGCGFDQVNYRVKTRKGRVFMVEDYGRLIEDPEMGPLFYVFIAPEKTKQDLLTGLFNMNFFIDIANRELREFYDKGASPVILSFNLSGMKRFNNKYGHDEGDKLLVAFSDILRRFFGVTKCSRFGEDHFYAYMNTDDIEAELNGLIMELHEANEGRTLPVRIGIVSYDPQVEIAELCDRAKIACDAMRKVFYGSGFKWFDEGMLEKYNLQQYILENLDRAIANQWIKVYLQPVVRTFSGKLCSSEALARWEDPELGVISPGSFVPLLEERGLSYRLDLYIANRVAEIQARRMREGEPVAPVSINLSRADFEVVDPVEQFIRIAEEHGIRRNLLIVEITESALVNDGGVIKKAIERFHEEGFEVWMDDFGSGFSSLNVLKDYDFDEIKLDMVFIKDLSQRSKDIMISTIQMAKKLGIHTLAEGVETEEQLHFLKQIGCEKIQGFYYGRPMLAKDVRPYLTSMHLGVETREISSFYSKAGLIDVISDGPFALFLFDGTKFKILYENDKYSELVSLSGYTNDEVIEMEMNNDSSALRGRFLRLAEKAKASKQLEHLTFTSRGVYYHLTFRVVASSRIGQIFEASLSKVILDEQKAIQQLENVVRNIVSIYDAIYLFDVDRDSRTVIVTDMLNEHIGEEIHGLTDYYKSGRDPRQFHPDDLERLKKFSSQEYIREKLIASGRGTFGDVFRIKDSNGNYIWTEIRIVAIPETNHNRYLLCLAPSEWEDQEEKNSIMNAVMSRRGNVIAAEPQYVDKENLITDMDFVDALIRDSSIKLFWKDKNRRFLGASNAFLAYYGFASVNEILGKTDEEIGWHVEDDTFKNYEEEILKKGKTINSTLGKNVIGGSVRGISASKFPIYHNNRICGLMGYFYDVEEDVASNDRINREDMTDPLTGFLNVQGFMSMALSYDDAYRIGNQDYTFINIEITTYNHVKADYGEGVANNMLRMVAERISAHFGIGAMIARVQSSHFMMCLRNLADIDILDRLNGLRDEVRQIREVDECSVQVDMVFGLAKGSEMESVQEVFDLSKNRIIAFQSKIKKESKKKEIKPDPYRDFPVPYIVCRALKNDKNETYDYEYIYVNQKYCELTGKTREEMLGHGYYECFPFAGEKWREFCDQAIQGGYIRGRAYATSVGQWTEFIMAPSSTPGCFMVLLQVDVEKKYRERLQTGHATDELIIKMARILGSEGNMLKAVDNMLEKLGEVMKADRLFVLTVSDGKVSCTNEWCDEGVQSFIHGIKMTDKSEMDPWIHIMEGRGVSSFDNVENLKEMYPELYKRTVERGVKRFMIAPLRDNDGELIGYIGVDNYELEAKVDLKKLLEITSFFLSVRLLVPQLK